MTDDTPNESQDDVQGFATVNAAQTKMLKTQTIAVEVDILKGLHAFKIVGLAGKAVEESRDRVSAAIKNAGFGTPKKKNQKIVIALAPADVKKSGPVFDLPIAMAYLLADEQIEFDPANSLFVGELSLNGELKSIDGILPISRHAKDENFAEIIVPEANAEEAALVDGIDVLAADSLKTVVNHFSHDTDFFITPEDKTEITYSDPDHTVDFSDVRGNETAKRRNL
jgi:magnesium chelatase family protein